MTPTTIGTTLHLDLGTTTGAKVAHVARSVVFGLMCRIRPYAEGQSN